MDREMVIKDLEEYRDREFVKEGITFFDADPRYRKLIINNALALLKEQEAVKPKSKVRHGVNAQIQHFCGNCNSMLHGKPKYCSECGKGVLW